MIYIWASQEQHNLSISIDHNGHGQCAWPLQWLPFVCDVIQGWQECVLNEGNKSQHFNELSFKAYGMYAIEFQVLVEKPLCPIGRLNNMVY